MFEIQNLKFKKILDIPSLTLDKSVNCIVGASGSGKTTLLRLLNRLYEPDSGEIKYNNIPIKQTDPVLLRRKIVMLGQTPILYEGNLADNLQAGLRFSEKNDTSESTMLSVLKKVGLEQELTSYCDKLSGGEQQRLCLARVLLLDAETYLMDEPSASLDKQTEFFMIQNLARHVQENNKQLILVTHSEQVSEMFPGCIIQLDHGRLKEEI